MRSHIRVSDVALPKDSNISSQDDITNLTNLIAATKALLPMEVTEPGMSTYDNPEQPTKA